MHSKNCTMVVGWHVTSRAIRTGLVRTDTEVVNWGGQANALLPLCGEK